MVADREFQNYSEGIFKPYFEKFIEFKRSKGEKVGHSALSRMRALNDELNSYGLLNVTKEIAEKILAPRDGMSANTRYARISFLRQFLNFMNTLGIGCYQIPYRYTKSIRCEFRPYIFSDGELKRLFAAADSLPDWHHSCRRHDIYPVIIRLLVSSGIRISEALHLKPGDIDIDTGIIKVINGKNGVSRYVPLSDSMMECLRPYLQAHINDPWLFTSPLTGSFYSDTSVRCIYKKLCKTADIYKTDGKIPNLHSLRHTFCTKSLDQLLAAGMDIYTAVPILAAYVGHVNFRDTESYIHFTEISYGAFQEKQSALQALIPEVDGYE